MFEDYVPQRKIGTLCPLAVIDNHAYEFYQLGPRGVMLVMVPLGLQQFTAQDVERVFEPIDERLDMLWSAASTLCCRRACRCRF